MVLGPKGCKIPPSGGGNGAGGQEASLSRTIDDGPHVDTKGSADMTSSTSEEKEGTDLGESDGCSSKGTAGRKTEETEIPASVLEFFELNHRAMLGKRQTADGSGGSASLEAGKRQSDCGQNAIGRQEYDFITTQASKRSRPRHSTSANKGTIEKSSSRFCWRSRIYDCGCEECDQESELDEEETELVSEALFEETRLLRHRLLKEVEEADGSNHGSNKRRPIFTSKGNSELSKCTRCFSYKKSSRFNGSVCNGCKRRVKKEIEEERLPEDIDVIVSRCCKTAEDVSAEEACAACFVVECDEGDEMIQCEGCSIWVHASCYGGELYKQANKPGQKEHYVPHVPEGDWFCQACEFKRQALPGTKSPKMRCVLCPVRIGAFKRTVDGRWMHLSCMRVMNETEAVQPWKQEPLSGICDIKWRKWAQKCMVCGTSAGACVQCHAKDCENMFHVGCAQYAKEGKFVMIFTEDKEEWLRLCRDCSPEAKVKSEPGS